MFRISLFFLICVFFMIPCSFALAQGWAIKFSGNPGQQVQAEDSPSLDVNGKKLTMEAWVYPMATVAEMIIMNKEGSYECAIRSGALQWAINAGKWDWFGTGDVPSFQWSHVAITYDGAKTICWVNGKKTHTEKTNSGNITTTDDPFNVGWRPFGAHSPFNGIIDEVRVSNTARYTNDFERPDTAFLPDDDTVILLHFDERQGKTTSDASSNHNDAELIGSPEWVESDAPFVDASSVTKQGKLSIIWANIKK